MKRILSLLLATLLILSLALSAISCGKKEPAPTATAEKESVETLTEMTATETEAEKATEDGAVSPLLWKVTDDEGHTLYLFGTIHVGDERNDIVLQRVSGVLDSCDALAVEFDAVAYENDTQKMIQDLQQYLLTDGSTVSDHMPEELYKKAYDLLKQAGLFPSFYKQYNLAMWSQLVESAMILVYTELDTDHGMDDLLIHRAYDKNKPVLDVESGEFQMALLNSFDDELYLMMIEEALGSADIYKDEMDKMYGYWLAGDRETLWDYLMSEEESGLEDYTEEQLALIEDYNRALLDDRNLGMRDKAIGYLDSGETVFFAVGAAHMAGDMGLVQLLTDAGYTVEEIAY